MPFDKAKQKANKEKIAILNKMVQSKKTVFKSSGTKRPSVSRKKTTKKTTQKGTLMGRSTVFSPGGVLKRTASRKESKKKR